jgi:phage terminase Nu1 subunit (DNA packaging protein)
MNVTWQSVEKRPTWYTVTSRELANILGVNLQTINNWLVRGKLPAPEPRVRGKSNKNRYKISVIKKWLCDTPEDKTHWEFINTHMAEDFESIEQAMWNAERYWRAFEIEQKI